MLTLEDWDRIAQLNSAYGDSGGVCFGTTDPSRLRPTFHRPMPALKPGSPTRSIVMVDDGQGNMVRDDRLPEKK